MGSNSKAFSKIEITLETKSVVGPGDARSTTQPVRDAKKTQHHVGKLWNSTIK